jgi:hypothetical protein
MERKSSNQLIVYELRQTLLSRRLSPCLGD